MKLDDGRGERLMTDNYMHVNSQAVRSIDYSPKSKTMEVEFIDGEVYHYYKVPAGLWKRIQDVATDGGSVGTFVNQDVKAEVKKLDLDYRRIITD
jgi:hypothetical protein